MAQGVRMNSGRGGGCAPSGRRRDLEREAERRDLVARMVVGVSQLRQSIKLLRFVRGALVDSRIQVDEVLTRFAGGREVDDYVALAVEAAGVAHVGIIIGRHVDVVVFGPADTV